MSINHDRHAELLSAKVSCQLTHLTRILSVMPTYPHRSLISFTARLRNKPEIHDHKNNIITSLSYPFYPLTHITLISLLLI